MAEHFSFLNRLRLDLGKSYTIAEEHMDDLLRVNVLVRRQHHDEMLAIVVDTRWLAALTQLQTADALAEYKRLTGLVSAFFHNPEALPSQSFPWPGSPESREELARALFARRRLS